MKLKILTEANEIYHNFLLNHPPSLNYLISRGFDIKTIKKFKLGYCYLNNGYNILKDKYTEQELIDSLLFKKGKTEKYENKKNVVRPNIYDFFYNRITIPLFYNNEIVHMTSRALPDRVPKHLHLEGKFDNVVNEDILNNVSYVFIVEGPFDCYTLDKHNINAIGFLGAQRIKNMRIISKLQKKDVYILFDREDNKTGEKAARKLANKLLLYNIPSKIVNFDKGEGKEDVNSYFMNHNVNDFKLLVKRSSLYTKSPQYKRNFHMRANKFDIVGMASKYIELIETNGKFKMTCPFHNDNDPSLVLYPNNSSFYCFGCGEAGNTIKLLKQLEFKRGNVLSWKQALQIGKEYENIS